MESGLAYCGRELITAVKRFWVESDVFFVMRVPGQGLERRESGKTVLYLQIIIILISYIIKLLIKRKTRTIPKMELRILMYIFCFIYFFEK